MDLSLLHKKLLPNWSAWTVSKSLSTSESIDAITVNFDKLEKKIKMRVLLSLLNLDPKVKADCSSSIKELLRLATDEEKNGKVRRRYRPQRLIYFVTNAFCSSITMTGS